MPNGLLWASQWRIALQFVHSNSEAFRLKGQPRSKNSFCSGGDPALLGRPGCVASEPMSREELSEPMSREELAMCAEITTLRRVASEAGIDDRHKNQIVQIVQGILDRFLEFHQGIIKKHENNAAALKKELDEQRMQSQELKGKLDKPRDQQQEIKKEMTTLLQSIKKLDVVVEGTQIDELIAMLKGGPGPPR